MSKGKIEVYGKKNPNLPFYPAVRAGEMGVAGGIGRASFITDYCGRSTSRPESPTPLARRDVGREYGLATGSPLLLPRPGMPKNVAARTVMLRIANGSERRRFSYIWSWRSSCPSESATSKV